jgi:2-methylisocitrate lyase-like PEP mutase family enzyme
VERIAAAAQAARALPFPFLVTARAHNLLYADPSLEETIRRLQAFENAGADVLFAPGLPDLDAVRAVCAAVSKPVNFMVGIMGKSFSVAELAAAGVRRISLATSLHRAAMWMNRENDRSTRRIIRDRGVRAPTGATATHCRRRLLQPSDEFAARRNCGLIQFALKHHFSGGHLSLQP